MLETGLEAVAYNLNRKNNNIQFFEFGKTYAQKAIGKYEEYNHLCLYITGNRTEDQWKGKGTASDVYFLKGLLKNILASLGIPEIEFNISSNSKLEASLTIIAQNKAIGEFGMVAKHEMNRFDIKQPVYFADLFWDDIMNLVQNKKIRFKELPKQLPVFRDLAVVLPKDLEYGTVEKSILAARIQKLTSIKLFDVFESDKIGAGKKSMALSFTFVDEEKTLTDKEIESMMNRIMGVLEKDLNAEIRK
jgi:phenylalanyl-tRNA synthetase beta chain